MQLKYGSTSLYDQNCSLQSPDRQTESQTERQTHTWTDKSLKTEGPKILSNYIFYFKNVIIGGPIWLRNKLGNVYGIIISQCTDITSVLTRDYSC